MKMRIDGPIRDIPPCKDCQDRYILCHDKCKRYADWKSEIERVKEEKRKYNKMLGIHTRIN